MERESRRIEKLADMVRHVGIDPLVPGGRDRVPFDQRPASERALQRFGRALETDIGLSRSKDDSGRRLGLALAHLDEISGADAGIGALQTIEPDDVDILVLAIGADRPRRGRPLADDFDHVAFGQPKLVHQLVRQSREAAPTVGRRQARHLDLARYHAIDRVGFGHHFSCPALIPIAQRCACARFTCRVNI